MTQQLKVLVDALPEDLGSIPKPGDLMPSPGLFWHYARIWCSPINRQTQICMRERERERGEERRGEERRGEERRGEERRGEERGDGGTETEETERGKRK
jgi:hypothetical protein